ncbi:TPA: prepilin peptidase, partial [Yersinia enterocolitica]|nr:prepilin peptidase [Yersinia enterocolitica]HDL8360282.1 prepilin peptidase [Yersinia enterocolitica]HDL8368209.1 prepilin peptidase [Yersinia enterocolitica]
YVGNILNVVIYRLPIMLSNTFPGNALDHNKVTIYKNDFNLFFPKSFCPNCLSSLPYKYSIPILGWFYLQGIAQCCNQRISLRYIIVEILTVILTLVTILFFHDDKFGFFNILLVWGLIVLVFIDIDCYLLPNCITQPLLWCGLLLNMYNAFLPLSFYVLGAVCGYLFLWLPNWIFKILKGIDGMGYGDFKLMAALGAWFGVAAVPFIILLSSLFGVVAYVIINKFSREKVKYVAFGPYISLTGLVYLFWGESVTCLLC